MCVCPCPLFRNLKKCEESVSRVQGEQEENEKSLAEFGEQLKKLEEEAGEIMKACQEAEVSTLLSLGFKPRRGRTLLFLFLLFFSLLKVSEAQQP